MKPNIFVVGTGGAIAAKKVKGVWLFDEFTAKDILEIVPEVNDKMQITASSLFRTDSADIQPENWLTLAQMVYYKLPEVDGVVITHGTDTMHYTAIALSFLIQNLNVPIVLTGSQAIFDDVGSDAKRNLLDSLNVAAFADLAETVVVFNGKIIRGIRSKKVNASQFNGFRSLDCEKLGTVQQFIYLNGKQRKRNNKKPRLCNTLEPSVSLLRIHPGFDPEMIELLVEKGVKGIVLEGYGLGNVPTKKRGLNEAIRNAEGAGIPVVITSECELGRGWQKIYYPEIGKRLENLNVIHGYGMLSETALIKLMWVLGQTSNMKKVEKLMHKNIAGETNGIVGVTRK
ncbi:MAG: asparaginase [Candidatus Diapherotrites archaeon]